MILYNIYVKFLDLLSLDFLDLDKFLTFSLVLSLLALTILFLSAVSVLGAKFHNLIVFKIKVSNVAIWLKSQIKY